MHGEVVQARQCVADGPKVVLSTNSVHLCMHNNSNRNQHKGSKLKAQCTFPQGFWSGDLERRGVYLGNSQSYRHVKYVILLTTVQLYRVVLSECCSCLNSLHKIRTHAPP
eukprot:1152828-Pelagomonas_calceolata.AAC.1